MIWPLPAFKLKKNFPFDDVLSSNFPAMNLLRLIFPDFLVEVCVREYHRCGKLASEQLFDEIVAISRGPSLLRLMIRAQPFHRKIASSLPADGSLRRSKQSIALSKHLERVNAVLGQNRLCRVARIRCRCNNSRVFVLIRGKNSCTWVSPTA